MSVVDSMSAKDVAIRNVFIISSGSMRPILIGMVGAGIARSRWPLHTGLILTLLLGFARRRGEFLLSGNDDGIERASQRRMAGINGLAVLDQLTGITAAFTILYCGLYSVNRDTKALRGSDGLLYTVLFVTYGIFCHLLLLHRRYKTRGFGAKIRDGSPFGHTAVAA